MRASSASASQILGLRMIPLSKLKNISRVSLQSSALVLLVLALYAGYA
jgi:hypothetical protein